MAIELYSMLLQQTIDLLRIFSSVARTVTVLKEKTGNTASSHKASPALESKAHAAEKFQSLHFSLNVQLGCLKTFSKFFALRHPRHKVKDCLWYPLMDRPSLALHGGQDREFSKNREPYL